MTVTQEQIDMLNAKLQRLGGFNCRCGKGGLVLIGQVVQKIDPRDGIDDALRLLVFRCDVCALVAHHDAAALGL